MKIFWLFRSNLKSLEYYHSFKTLEEFVENCHDYYMLLLIWLLKKGYIDTAVVWRLTDTPIKDINFFVNGRMFSQRWVRDFSEVYNYPSPEYTLFRGGFPEYDKVVNEKPKHFGKKLYLGTGKRIYPQYGGQYDCYLQEDVKDFDVNKPCLPFYKTASPYIFHPLENIKVKYDICWPANFTQNRYKGQDYFMNLVGHCPKLKSLRIIHCGNKPEVGKKMAKKYNVTNIKFAGLVDRPTLNKYLNESKFGLCLSNRQDGCPRVATEILMSGTPMILRKMTRLLPYYKEPGVIGANDNNMIVKIMGGFPKWPGLKLDLHDAIKTKLSFDTICQKNIDSWKQL